LSSRVDKINYTAEGVCGRLDAILMAGPKIPAQVLQDMSEFMARRALLISGADRIQWPSGRRLTAIVRASEARAWNTTSGQSPGAAALPALGDSYMEAAIQSFMGDEAIPAPAPMQEPVSPLKALPNWCVGGRQGQAYTFY